MATPYLPLTDDEKFFHINDMVDDNGIPISGIFASGEGNFYDLEQFPVDVTYNGYNGYSISFEQGSEPLSNETLVINSGLAIIGATITPTYSSGDVQTLYTHYTPDPSGGTGLLDKKPFNVSFDPQGFLIKNSG